MLQGAYLKDALRISLGCLLSRSSSHIHIIFIKFTFRQKHCRKPCLYKVHHILIYLSLHAHNDSCLGSTDSAISIQI